MIPLRSPFSVIPLLSGENESKSSISEAPGDAALKFTLTPSCPELPMLLTVRPPPFGFTFAASGENESLSSISEAMLALAMLEKLTVAPIATCKIGPNLRSVLDPTGAPGGNDDGESSASPVAVTDSGWLSVRIVVPDPS